MIVYQEGLFCVIKNMAEMSPLFSWFKEKNNDEKSIIFSEYIVEG